MDYEGNLEINSDFQDIYSNLPDINDECIYCADNLYNNSFFEENKENVEIIKYENIDNNLPLPNENTLYLDKESETNKKLVIRQPDYGKSIFQFDPEYYKSLESVNVPCKICFKKYPIVSCYLCNGVFLCPLCGYKNSSLFNYTTFDYPNNYSKRILPNINQSFNNKNLVKHDDLSVNRKRKRIQ